MGIQLIFCVEADLRSKSDYIYIKNTIEHFYTYDRAQVKLSPIYMGSKWKYNQNKVLKQIEQLIKKYNSASKENKTEVFYCVDCDDFDVRKEDSDYLDKLNVFCTKRKYNVIWFCKEIESVYLGKRINDNAKKTAAVKFAVQRKIEGVDQKMLYGKKYKDKCSNICGVLDLYINDLI